MAQSRLHVINDKTQTGTKGDTVTIGLERSFMAKNIVIQFAINHTNASALASTVTPYEFFSDTIRSVRVDAGAGNDFIDLGIRDLMIRMLKDHGNLIYTLNKTIGEQVSYLTLIVDFESVNMMSPKDTVLNTEKYNHLNLVTKLGNGDTVADLTLDGVSISVREQQVSNMTPLTDGKGGFAPLLHRKPVQITKSVVADQNNFTIELPVQQKFSQIVIYAKRGELVVDDVIDTIKVKIKQSLRWSDTMSQLNGLNRLGLQSYADTNFNGIALLDFGEGQWAGSINTNLPAELNGVIELGVTMGAGSPEIVVMFETLVGA